MTSTDEKRIKEIVKEAIKEMLPVIADAIIEQLDPDKTNTSDKAKASEQSNTDRTVSVLKQMQSSPNPLSRRITPRR